MSVAQDAEPADQPHRLGPFARARRFVVTLVYNTVKDTAAGFVASVVLIANIVAFGALMFPGNLSAGIPVAVWAMLIGACVSGLWIALNTSLPPLATSIDSPTGAVLVLLSAMIGPAALAAGAGTDTAVETVMLMFTAATLLSGALLYALGVFQWGSYCRFAPYFVVGGFLAATGWFLIAGGVRMTTGRMLSIESLVSPWTVDETVKLLGALAVLAVLLALRRWIKSALAMPIALLAMWLLGVVVLQKLGLSGPEHHWYLPSLGTLSMWLPFKAANTSLVTYAMLIKFAPELFAVTFVALISLISKVSSIEVARQKSGDLDREFRAHGIGSLLSAPAGGITTSLQLGAGRLLENVGGASRMSGAIAALVLGGVAISNFDLPGLIPIPIVAGLVFFLGYTFLSDAFWRPLSQRAWLDLLLAFGIAVACVRYGYVFGVLAGLVCACILFAMSYARLGVVRRHVTRAQFVSYVDRSTEASRYLREHGGAIQIYWLSGYIFFGSSESVFERIRTDIDAMLPLGVAYVILDFSMVSGADSSALVSLTKLQNFSNQRGITLVYCSLSPANQTALASGRFFGGKSRHQLFVDLNVGLAWCEDRLLAGAKLDADMDVAGFQAWLQHQLGSDVVATQLFAYLERKETAGAQILYREGEPADTIDLVAAGHLVVEIGGGDAKALRVRQAMTHTIVGEMGFFRRAARSATVSADGAAVLFTLTRANFDRLRRERPDVASAFDDFIIRVLADRIDFANRVVAALSR